MENQDKVNQIRTYKPHAEERIRLGKQRGVGGGGWGGGGAKGQKGGSRTQNVASRLFY